MTFILVFIVTFFLCLLGRVFVLGWLKIFNFYTTVNEGRCKVYILFGKVLGVIDQPGLHFLWLSLGPQAALVNLFGFGRVYEIDLRLEQEYLRSNPVNSEEGTPMGVGVWYEMRIKNPVDYLFKNVDPRGSLRANVANATVRSLSNMPLEKLLEDRHEMSRLVRIEVSPKSQEWGYELGSIYIRKVHFRDAEMIRQIEQSKRAVEIETNRAQAEVQPLRWLAQQIAELKTNGEHTLPAYLRNVRLDLFSKAKRIVLTRKEEK